MEHVAPDHQPGPDVLALYHTAVRAITSQLQQPQLPAYCVRVSTQDRLAGGTHSNSSAAAGAGRSRCAGLWSVFGGGEANATKGMTASISCWHIAIVTAGYSAPVVSSSVLYCHT